MLSALRSTSERLPIDHLRRLDTSRLAMQISQIRQQLKQKIPLPNSRWAKTAQPASATVCLSTCPGRGPKRVLRENSGAMPQRESSSYVPVSRRCTITSPARNSSSRIPTTDRNSKDSLPSGTGPIRNRCCGSARHNWATVSSNGPSGTSRPMVSVSSAVPRQEACARSATCPLPAGRRPVPSGARHLADAGQGQRPGGRGRGPARHAAGHSRTASRYDGRGQRQIPSCIFLPAIPAVGAEQSLVLPPGWFRSLRVISLSSDRIWQVRLVCTCSTMARITSGSVSPSVDSALQLSSTRAGKRAVKRLPLPGSLSMSSVA